MTDAPRAVQVAVEALADRPERTFTYLVPQGVDAIAPGSLVLVPYGRRLALGYVVPGTPEGDAASWKAVEAVVSEPMLTPDLLTLADEIAQALQAILLAE